MTSIVKSDKTSILKKRNVSHASVKIEAAQETETNAETMNMLETRNESFFKSVWPVIFFAQFMGFMPVQGIRTADPSKFDFRWKSFRVMITMIYFAFGSFIAGGYLLLIARIGINAKNVVGFVFYGMCILCGLLFLFLAQKWKDLAVVWCRHEKVFLNLPYKECGWRLSTKIRFTASVFLFFGIVEHLMAVSNSVFNFYMKVSICKKSADDAWKHYFLNEYRHIFMFLPYRFVFTLLIEWMIISFTFGWNYMDVFIIVTSIGLATRFKQINHRLEAMKNESMNESTWREIRHDYVLLCELVEIVDRNLAALTLLSCANNLYFVCFQLLNTFNTLPYLINYVYFWYSLLYLIGRTTAVFLIASSINDAAKCSIKFVRQRQTSEWCVELERFGDQITTQVVALSGMKFFFITRSLLFGMAGTIVTYELVLLQFDEGTKKAGNETFCNYI